MTDQKKVLGISLVTALSIATGSSLLAADKKTAAEIGAEYAANVPKVMDGKKYPGLHHTTAIPTNFPLPKYPNHVISTNFVNSVKGTPVASLGIVTTDPPKTVFSWYQNQCQGSGWSASLPPPECSYGKRKIWRSVSNERIQKFPAADY